MPAKNIVKLYIENGFYHAFNRGAENHDIFLEEQDYKVFLHFLKRYLTEPPKDPNRLKPPFRGDLFDQVELIAYCLMPNHFHLMLKQRAKEAMTELIRALSNSYVRYFNKKYKRAGSLFQSTYKAVLVESEPQLLHLTRYIHLNPLNTKEVRPLKRSNLIKKYPYSSYLDYLGERHTTWLHPEEILAFFKTAQRTGLKDILSYQSFVEDYVEDSTEILGSLTLE